MRKSLEIMKSNISIGCIIMASGQGKRFGSNKLMVDFFGEPLVASVLKTTEKLFNKRIVVTRHDSVADYCKNNNIKYILHNLPNRNDTVRLGLEKMQEVTHCIFMMGDQPLIKRKSLQRIIDAVSTDPEYIWRFIYQGTLGAPVVFPRKYFRELQALPDGKGGGVLLKKYSDQVRTVSVKEPYELMDIDTPEDLEKLKCLKEQ